MNQLGLRDGQQTAAKGRTAEEGEGESAKPLARQLFTRGQDKMDWFFRAFNSTRIYETFLKSFSDWFELAFLSPKRSW